MGTCDADIILNFAAEMGSNPELYIIFFGHKKTEMAGNEIGDADAVSKGQKAHHTISGNILLFQINQILKGVVQKLQSANFVTTPSVAAVLQGQQPTFCGVLY